jgi:predicted RNase H-like HicB family nuclease
MKIRRRTDGYWIVAVPDLPVGGVPRVTECGPYTGETLKEAREEAEDDMAGLERFFVENPVN